MRLRLGIDCNFGLALWELALQNLYSRYCKEYVRLDTMYTALDLLGVNIVYW